MNGEEASSSQEVEESMPEWKVNAPFSPTCGESKFNVTYGVTDFIVKIKSPHGIVGKSVTLVIILCFEVFTRLGLCSHH